MMRLLFAVCLLLPAAWSPALAQGWTPARNTMSDLRWAPAYTLLAGGSRGLIVGGYSFPAGRCVATADEFDPASRRFLPCKGRLQVPRNFAQASLLPGGQVLISGGYNTVLGSLRTAELFDPITQTFRILPSQLETPRELFTATTLTDGQVLIAGGFNTHRGRTQASAELYDPATEVFTPTAPMVQDRFGQAAARLRDGRVLIVGGTHWFAGRPGVPLASAEIYDPVTGQFKAAHGPMEFARDRPTATLLPDGTVLVAGGQNGAEEPDHAEIFDPVSETFHTLPSPMVSPRMAHCASQLPDGTVLLSGGWSVLLAATTGSVESYDPQTQSFAACFSLPVGAHDQAMLVFPDGLALIAGGKAASAGRETSLATGFTRQFPHQ